jgi:hypothetical protein
MANGPGTPNYVDGYGDLADPETMLYYKLHLAIGYRDQQLNNPNCSASELYDVIENIGLLRAQLNALHDSDIALKAPLQADIDSIKALATQVESLTNTAADLVAGFGLLDQVVTQTETLTAG